MLILLPTDEHAAGILVGAVIIIIVGFLDDMLEITAKAKLAGQLAAAVVVVTWGGLQIEFINLPFFGQFDFGYLSIPITIIWIIGITNAINLIDGLDGLAAGVSTIALIYDCCYGDDYGECICCRNSCYSCSKFSWIPVFQFSSGENFYGRYGILIPGLYDFSSCIIRI